jgi:maltose O-acetyltransferase
METEKQKMIAGKMYNAQDPEIKADVRASREKVAAFNQSAHTDIDTRKKLLSEIFGTTDENCYVEPPLRVDFGSNIHVGKNFYANFNCVFLDCAPIRIGDNTMFGPYVQVYTATHPLDAIERCSGLEYAKAISIGDMCWIGGGAILCPGVTIGDRYEEG